MTETAFDRSHLDVDLTDAALYANGFPHEVFTALRRDAPVKWQAFPEGFRGDHDEGFWVLSKHEDVQAVSRDPELFSAFDGPQLSRQPGIAGTMLVSMDGRDHLRQRRLISAGFTPRMVKQLEHQIRQWAESIVDRALRRGECDFVSEIAYKLPMNVIADIVGIPVEDREWLFSLTNDFLQGDAPERGMSQEELLGIQVEMFEYAQRLGQEKRAEPAGRRLDDPVDGGGGDRRRRAHGSQPDRAGHVLSPSHHRGQRDHPKCCFPGTSGASRPSRPARASPPGARGHSPGGGGDPPVVVAGLVLCPAGHPGH